MQYFLDHLYKSIAVAAILSCVVAIILTVAADYGQGIGIQVYVVYLYTIIAVLALIPATVLLVRYDTIRQHRVWLFLMSFWNAIVVYYALGYFIAHLHLL